MSEPRSVLVVGAGLAGSRCAETLRAEGFDGRLVLVGDEPLPPYERPALSKEFLARKRDERDLLLRPAHAWDEAEIELRLGERVVAIDRTAGTATTDRGSAFSWDALVLATGARPRRLPFANPSGVHVLRTIDDARSLRTALVPGARLAVIGGGFVGAEVASTARELGVEVTIIEAGPTPFARVLGHDVGALLRERYERYGVDVKTNATVTGYRTDVRGRLHAATIAGGDDVRCDAALVAVGVEPVDDLSVPEAADIHTCGDASGGPGHWTHAAASAANTARTLLGRDPVPMPPPFFWSDQFELRIQLVGDPSAAGKVELKGDPDRFVARYLDADEKLVAALAANRPDTIGGFRRELAFAA